MIHSYYNYIICNEYTSQCLKKGEDVNRLSYWDNGNRVTVEAVQIKDINKDEIMVETKDYDEITIPIEEIEDWN